LQPLNVSSGKSTVRFSQRNGAALTGWVYLAYDRLRKTLTSFKAARLATELDFIDKVFFVVDRKDLDYQTMKEYQRFSPDSVNGSDSTAGLKRNIDKDDNKIIVTTIQKLNNLMKGMQI
jgi:type I site-specific restriction-modification system R (restriction) subunit